MRKLVLAASALALTAPVIAPAAAEAHRTGYRHSHQQQYQDRLYCRKRNGTTGLIVGGAAGALAGRELDKGRSRTTGTVLGGAVGALLGRHVERNMLSRRCG